jgi:hypothetical protein
VDLMQFLISFLFVLVFILARKLRKVLDWKERIEGSVSGEWASEKQFSDFRDYFFQWKYGVEEELRKLRERTQNGRRPQVPNKWKPWV